MALCGHGPIYTWPYIVMAFWATCKPDFHQSAQHDRHAVACRGVPSRVVACRGVPSWPVHRAHRNLDACARVRVRAYKFACLHRGLTTCLNACPHAGGAEGDRRRAEHGAVHMGHNYIGHNLYRPQTTQAIIRMPPHMSKRMSELFCTQGGAEGDQLLSHSRGC